MTRLGSGNLLVRAAYAAAGWLDPDFRRRGCRPAIIGHRGVAREEPENTVSSFARALARGADGVEVDVCATADGRFVLWHDADPDDVVALARQAGGEKYAYRPDAPALGSRWRRPVRELSLDELRAHYRLVPDGGGDAAHRAVAPVAPRNGAPRESAPRIELLEDLLAWAGGESRLRHVLLDLKLLPPDAPRALELFEVVRRAASEASLSRVTFHLLNTQKEVVADLARAHAESGRPDRVRVSADVELAGAVRAADACGAPDVSLGCGERLWAGFRREVCGAVRAREQGRFGYVAAWTVNGERRLRRLAATGVNAVVTDEPEALRRVTSAWQGDC